MSLIPYRYQEILSARGRSLRDIGVAEIALRQRDALEAIDSLRGSPIAILGGDVRRIVNQTPRYTKQNWYADRSAQEELAEYVRRSQETASDFIRDYPDPKDGTILYTLVLSEMVLG